MREGRLRKIISIQQFLAAFTVGNPAQKGRKMRINWFVNCILLSASLVSCTGNMGSEIDSTLPGEHDDLAKLGQGYDSGKKTTIKSKCIESIEIDSKKEIYKRGKFGGNSQFTFNYLKDESFLNVLQKINGTFGAEATFPTVRANANVELAKEHSSDEYTLTHSFFFKGIAGKRYIDNIDAFELTDRGNRAFDLRRFRHYCGDEFVSEIQYGTILIGTLKVTLRDSKDKLNVKGSLEVKFDGGSASPIGASVNGSGEYLSEEILKTSKVQFTVQQFGGDPTDFLGQLNKVTVDCSLTNLEACNSTIKSVFDYANTDYRSSLNKNSETSSVASVIENWNVVQIETTPYDMLLLSKPLNFETYDSELLDFEVSKMERLYEKAFSHAKRADYILSLGLRPENQDDIEFISESSLSNARLLSSSIKKCLDNFDDLTKCTLPDLADYEDKLDLLDVATGPDLIVDEADENLVTDLSQITSGKYQIYLKKDGKKKCVAPLYNNLSTFSNKLALKDCDETSLQTWNVNFMSLDSEDHLMIVTLSGSNNDYRWDTIGPENHTLISEIENGEPAPLSEVFMLNIDQTIKTSSFGSSTQCLSSQLFADGAIDLLMKNSCDQSEKFYFSKR